MVGNPPFLQMVAVEIVCTCYRFHCSLRARPPYDHIGQEDTRVGCALGRLSAIAAVGEVASSNQKS